MNVNGQKRTIIINTFNSKLLCRLPPNSLSLVAKETTDAKMERTSRKGRKRSLDHLTFEEKLLRKKLKNREAAQTSRDRKKARMEELEKVVTQLQKSNKELINQTQLLKSEKEELRQENEKLREELRCMQVRCTLESPNGSAESLVRPLPQGHSSALTKAPTFLLTWMISCLMIVCHGWRKPAIYEPSKIWFQICIRSPTIQRDVTLSLRKWWGRHQHCWNPTDYWM